MVARFQIRAFTPVDVLVVVLLCLFLLLVLPPVLYIHGGTAFRMTCGTHLSGIGKAMLIYANDYEDELPRAGGRDSQWAARTPDWAAPDRRAAFGLASDGSGGQASISASLYLLVKYSEVTPKSFLCASSKTSPFGFRAETREKGMSEFKLSGVRKLPKGFELIDAWDFGPDPTRHVSYSHHMPYGMYALNTSYLPGFAVAADRNPWMDSPSAKAKDFSLFKPDVPPFNGATEQGKHGNTFRHDGDGQNVLFLDSHVEFAKRAYCSIEDDNIYTISSSPTAGDPLGTPPRLGSQPANRKDSLLVNDPILIPDTSRENR
jgi:prepilin-type processing-associated H-X9-DG protein